MRRVVERAERSVFAALWDAELPRLAPALEAAHRRGVELQIAIYGDFRLAVPFSYDLALCGASAAERLAGRRLSVLIRDGSEAGAPGAPPGRPEGGWGE